jgi:hypothetical protein
MCCLGFECLALGLTEEQIYRIGMPDEIPFENPADLLDRLYPELVNERGTRSTIFARRAAAINDTKIGNVVGLDEGVFAEHEQIVLETEEQREALIAAEFLKEGVKVEFIN